MDESTIDWDSIQEIINVSRKVSTQFSLDGLDWSDEVPTGTYDHLYIREVWE
jgi:hypothetical protein